MRIFLLKRKLEVYWKKKVVRALCAALVLITAVVVQYVLANRPEPLDLQGAGKAFVPSVMRGQKLVVEAIDSSSVLVISHAGKTTEEVDVHLTAARLDEPTLSDFESDHPPSGNAEIDCSPIIFTTSPPANDATRQNVGSHQQRETGKRCSTSIEIAVGRNKDAALAFFQSDPPDRDSRYLDIELISAEGNVKIEMLPEILQLDDASVARLKSTGYAVACGRELKVGEWKQRIGGALEIGTVMAANSRLRTRFTPWPKVELWSGGANGFFDPFSFESSRGPQDQTAAIRSRAVSIRMVDNTQTLFTAQGTAGGELIHLDKLWVGSDRLQIELSGQAIVTVNNQVQTISLFERIKNPLVAGFLVLVNTALLTWLVGIVRSLLRSAP